MNDKEELKSMITNMIDDKTTEAEVDFHNYLKGRMADVISAGNAPADRAPAVVKPVAK